MKARIQKIITNLKHIFSNANYKVRYNNLLKKYETLEMSYNQLLDQPTNLKYYKNLANTYKRQRDALRKENIRLIEGGDDYGSKKNV